MDIARTNWIGNGQIGKGPIDNIFDHIDAQSQKRPGVNIWMAQYQHHRLFERGLPADIQQRAAEGVDDVMTCQATPAEYGILALGDLGLPRSYLPKGLAESRTRRDIHTLTYKAVTEGNGLDGNYHQQLRNHVELLEGKSWAMSFLFLSAPDLLAALEYYRQSKILDEDNKNQFLYYRKFREIEGLLFGFPTEDIPETFNGMKLGHALSEQNFDLGNRLAEQVHLKARLSLEAEIVKAKAKIERYTRMPLTILIRIIEIFILNRPMKTSWIFISVVNFFPTRFLDKDGAGAAITAFPSRICAVKILAA